MLLTSFAQNQPNACEDRTKTFCNLLCETVLKIPGIFVKKTGKRKAKKFIKSREFPEPGSWFSNPNLHLSNHTNAEQSFSVRFQVLPQTRPLQWDFPLEKLFPFRNFARVANYSTNKISKSYCIFVTFNKRFRQCCCQNKVKGQNRKLAAFQVNSR